MNKDAFPIEKWWIFQQSSCYFPAVYSVWFPLVGCPGGKIDLSGGSVSVNFWDALIGEVGMATGWYPPNVGSKLPDD